MLELFYEAVDSRIGDAEHASRCASSLFDQIAAWAKAHPASPTAISLYAMALNDRAWCYRGGDYADKGSGTRLVAVQVVHPAAARLAGRPQGRRPGRPGMVPEHGACRARPGLVRDRFSWPWSAPAATDIPTIFRSGRRGMAFFNPRWYGDNAKMEAFAEWPPSGPRRPKATPSTPGYTGMSSDALQLDDLKTQTDIDWTLMKGAMNDLTARNPNSWKRVFDGAAGLLCRRHELTMHEMRKVFPALQTFGDPGAIEHRSLRQHQRTKTPPAPEDCDHCKAR